MTTLIQVIVLQKLVETIEEELTDEVVEERIFNDHFPRQMGIATWTDRFAVDAFSNALSTEPVATVGHASVFQGTHADWTHQMLLHSRQLHKIITHCTQTLFQPAKVQFRKRFR